MIISSLILYKIFISFELELNKKIIEIIKTLIIENNLFIYFKLGELIDAKGVIVILKNISSLGFKSLSL